MEDSNETADLDRSRDPPTIASTNFRRWRSA